MLIGFNVIRMYLLNSSLWWVCGSCGKWEEFRACNLLFIEGNFVVNELILELLPWVGFISVVVDEWYIKDLFIEGSDRIVYLVDVEQSFVVEIKFWKNLQMRYNVNEVYLFCDFIHK